MTRPTLDVTFVLDSPEFYDDTLTVYRSQTAVDEFGRAHNTGIWLPFAGVVTPDNGRDLRQDGTGEMRVGTITIYTRMPLTGGGTEVASDRIRWGNGGPGNYVVINATPLAYGQGFTRAVCQLADVNTSYLTPGKGPGIYG